MTYAQQLQKKIYELDAKYLQARRSGNQEAAKLAKQMADEAYHEFKQAKFMEKN